MQGLLEAANTRFVFVETGAFPTEMSFLQHTQNKFIWTAGNGGKEMQTWVCLLLDTYMALSSSQSLTWTDAVLQCKTNRASNDRSFLDSVHIYFSSNIVGSFATEDASVEWIVEVTLAASSSSSFDFDSSSLTSLPSLLWSLSFLVVLWRASAFKNAKHNREKWFQFNSYKAHRR